MGPTPPTEASRPWDRSQPGGTEGGLLSMCGQLLCMGATLPGGRTCWASAQPLQVPGAR